MSKAQEKAHEWFMSHLGPDWDREDGFEHGYVQATEEVGALVQQHVSRDVSSEFLQGWNAALSTLTRAIKEAS